MPEQARRDTIAVAATAAGLNRLRRRVSLPAIRRQIAATASLELDRGVAFLLVPVLLATGAIAYFSLTTEPDFYRPAAVAALAAVCAAATRSWLKTHLACMALLFCALGFLAAYAMVRGQFALRRTIVALLLMPLTITQFAGNRVKGDS